MRQQDEQSGGARATDGTAGVHAGSSASQRLERKLRDGLMAPYGMARHEAGGGIGNAWKTLARGRPLWALMLPCCSGSRVRQRNAGTGSGLAGRSTRLKAVSGGCQPGHVRGSVTHGHGWAQIGPSAHAKAVSRALKRVPGLYAAGYPRPEGPASGSPSHRNVPRTGNMTHERALQACGRTEGCVHAAVAMGVRAAENIGRST